MLFLLRTRSDNSSTMDAAAAIVESSDCLGTSWAWDWLVINSIDFFF